MLNAVCVLYPTHTGCIHSSGTMCSLGCSKVLDLVYRGTLGCSDDIAPWNVGFWCIRVHTSCLYLLACMCCDIGCSFHAHLMGNVCSLNSNWQSIYKGRNRHHSPIRETCVKCTEQDGYTYIYIDVSWKMMRKQELGNHAWMCSAVCMVYMSCRSSCSHSVHVVSCVRACQVLADSTWFRNLVP